MKLQLFCPICKSSKIDYDNITQDNEIIGPGYSSWTIMDYHCCTDCGVMFQDIKGIKRKKKERNNKAHELREKRRIERKYWGQVLGIFLMI